MQAVGQAGDQRHLGADHHQVGLDPLRQRRQAFEIGDGDVMQLGERGDAGIPGSGVQRRQFGRQAQFPGKRVLACPRSNHQNAHGSESTSALDHAACLSRLRKCRR